MSPEDAGREDSRPLPMWVIYEHPLDFPQSYVVRRVEVFAGKLVYDAICTLHHSLEDARAALPEGLFCIGQQPDDDPSIRETWL